MHIEKTSYSVVRNHSYPKSNFALRQRHNERENESYSNPDIVPARTHLNIHFKQPEDTYCKVFDTMVSDGTISTRGLKPEADVFCEFVFDVNTACFEEHGGYEYAKNFFAEAYRFAVKEAGDEQYILSAVLHADERNRSLSEELGHDVYHYHLHVVYIPVVEKEIKYSKRCKDPKLRGTVKEVIHQVSRSKKWAYPEVKGTDGKTKRIPSYSVLQDRFHDHMKEHGFEGFERGKRGSTTEHLSTLEYKVQQDTKKLAQIEQQVQEKEQELTEVNSSLRTATQMSKTYSELESMGKRTLFGKVELNKEDYGTLVELAKEGIRSRSLIDNLRRELKTLRESYAGIKEQFAELYEQTKTFLAALPLAPQKIMDFLSGVIRQSEIDRKERERAERERREQEQRERAERRKKETADRKAKTRTRGEWER